jgi:hypothetical protein
MTRIALVHDWLTGMRGGERALEVICGTGAGCRPVHDGLRARDRLAAYRRAPGSHTTPLSFLPGIRHLYRHCLPLFPQRSRCSIWMTRISSSARATVRQKRRWPVLVPGTCAIASHRFATRGISSISTSGGSARGVSAQRRCECS